MRLKELHAQRNTAQIKCDQTNDHRDRAPGGQSGVDAVTRLNKNHISCTGTTHDDLLNTCDTKLTLKSELRLGLDARLNLIHLRPAQAAGRFVRLNRIHRQRAKEIPIAAHEAEFHPLDHLGIGTD